MEKYTEKWVRQQLFELASTKLDVNFKTMQEECIQNLPEIKKHTRIGTLVLQQIGYIPKYVYGLLAVMYVALICLTVMVETKQLGNMMHCFSGTLTIAVGLLLAFYNLSRRDEIREIEQSCKFGYNQIFFARTIWFLTVAIAYDFAVYILLSSKMESVISGMHTAVLIPVLMGACIALLFANKLGYRRNEGIIVTFIVTSILGNFIFLVLLKNIISTPWIGITICAALFFVLVIQCKNILKGCVCYEAYNIKFD